MANVTCQYLPENGAHVINVPPLSDERRSKNDGIRRGRYLKPRLVEPLLDFMTPSAGNLVGHEVDPRQHAVTPDVANHRQIAQSKNRVKEMARVRSAPLDQMVLLVNVERGQRRSASRRMRRMGVVIETFEAIRMRCAQDRVVDRLLERDGP